MAIANDQAAGEARAGTAWYAIYSKHQHEKTVADLLRRKDFEILLPTYRTVHRWKDRNKSVLLPLFPCYLFVQTELARKTEIVQTPGVFWLVESGGHACPISDSEIEALQKIVQSPTKIAPHPYLRIGERVRIRRGAFEGLEGIFTRAKNQFRVVLGVELLRKSVAVEVDLADLEPVALQEGKAAARVTSAGGQ